MSTDHVEPPIRRTNRARFVTTAAVAGTGLGLAALSLEPFTSAAPGPDQDAAILNLALQIEYLSAAFYAEAAAKVDDPELRRFATVVAAQEKEHVDFLTAALGAKAEPAPTFDFGTATTDGKVFGEAAVALEDLTVGALNGQATNLTNGALKAAARIVSVEARHAGWVRAIVGKDPSPSAADRGLTEAEVKAAITATGFVK